MQPKIVAIPPWGSFEDFIVTPRSYWVSTHETYWDSNTIKGSSRSTVIFMEDVLQQLEKVLPSIQLLEACREGEVLVVGPGEKPDEVETAIKYLSPAHVHAIDAQQSPLIDLAIYFNRLYPPGDPRRSMVRLYQQHAAYLDQPMRRSRSNEEVMVQPHSIQFVYSVGVYNKANRRILPEMVTALRNVLAPGGIAVLVGPEDFNQYFPPDEHVYTLQVHVREMALGFFLDEYDYPIYVFRRGLIESRQQG